MSGALKLCLGTSGPQLTARSLAVTTHAFRAKPPRCCCCPRCRCFQSRWRKRPPAPAWREGRTPCPPARGAPASAAAACCPPAAAAPTTIMRRDAREPNDLHKHCKLASILSAHDGHVVFSGIMELHLYGSITKGKILHPAAWGHTCAAVHIASMQQLRERPARLQQALLMLGVVGKHGADPEGEVARPHGLQLAHHQRVLARLRNSRSGGGRTGCPGSAGQGVRPGCRPEGARMAGSPPGCGPGGGSAAAVRGTPLPPQPQAPAPAARGARPCQVPGAGRSHAAPCNSGVAAT